MDWRWTKTTRKMAELNRASWNPDFQLSGHIDMLNLWSPHVAMMKTAVLAADYQAVWWRTSISPHFSLSRLSSGQKSCGCKSAGGIIASDDFMSSAAQQDLKGECVETGLEDAAGNDGVGEECWNELQRWISSTRACTCIHAMRRVLGRKENSAAIRKLLLNFLKM